MTHCSKMQINFDGSVCFSSQGLLPSSPYIIINVLRRISACLRMPRSLQALCISAQSNACAILLVHRRKNRHICCQCSVLVLHFRGINLSLLTKM